jgi:hypothetical protein
MMTSRILAVIAAFALLAPLAATAHAGSCSGIRCTAEIDRLYVHNNGNIYVGLDADETQLSNCTPSEGVYLVLRMSDLNAAAIYDTLLTMFMATRTVTIRTNDGGTCTIAYVVADA